MFSHELFIKETLYSHIEKEGTLKVGINLNNYLSFDIANNYAKNYAKNFSKHKTKDVARQEKSSKDSILGRLAEEIIIYLLDCYFKENRFNYLTTNNKRENETVEKIIRLLKIEKSSTGHAKHFDSDILIYNQDSFENTRRVFVLSAKGTTRERIGQFLSHLFLMDKDVLNAKYGKNKYEVLFTKENISLKYAFVTLDWANTKDFSKYSKNGKLRNTVKSTEVQLILDDIKMGGGIYVLNNLENIDGVKNFAGLVGTICDHLK